MQNLSLQSSSFPTVSAASAGAATKLPMALPRNDRRFVSDEDVCRATVSKEIEHNSIRSIAIEADISNFENGIGLIRDDYVYSYAFLIEQRGRKK
jgi:hypothetical protein